MIAFEFTSAVHKAKLVAAAALLGATIAGSARAGDCNEDVANLTKKRQAVIDQLNQLAKGGKNQLDPIASCPKLRSLAAAERELLAYLTKNKEWCSVPDNALQNISTSAAKTGQVANQACKVAEQMKKAQEQGVTGGPGQPPAQKLPAGPL